MSIDNVFLARVPPSEVDNIRIIAAYMCNVICNTVYAGAKNMLITTAASAVPGAKVSYSLQDYYRDLLSASAHALISGKTNKEKYTSYLSGLYAFHCTASSLFQSIDSYLLAIGTIFVPENVYIKMSDADRKTTVMTALSRAYADMCRYVSEPTMLNNLVDDRKNPAHMATCSSKAIELLVVTRESIRTNWIPGGSTSSDESLHKKLTDKLKDLLRDKILLIQENKKLCDIIDSMQIRINQLETHNMTQPAYNTSHESHQPHNTSHGTSHDTSHQPHNTSHDALHQPHNTSHDALHQPHNTSHEPYDRTLYKPHEHESYTSRETGADTYSGSSFSQRHQVLSKEMLDKDRSAAAHAHKSRMADKYDMKVSFSEPPVLLSIAEPSTDDNDNLNSNKPNDDIIALTANDEGTDEVLEVSSSSASKSRRKSPFSRTNAPNTSNDTDTTITGDVDDDTNKPLASTRSKSRKTQRSKKSVKQSSDSDDEPSDVDDDNN